MKNFILGFWLFWCGVGFNAHLRLGADALRDGLQPSTLTVCAVIFFPLAALVCVTTLVIRSPK